jgi:hypothetical protein
MTSMYEPDLLSVGIVLAPCPAVRPLLEQQLHKVIKSGSIHSAFETIDWREFFAQDGKLFDMSRSQIALLSPGEAITVYVCNLADGWVSLYGNLVKAGLFDAYLFRATLSERDQHRVFEMRAWRHGALERHVRALQDEDDWKFLDKGDPMPFESPMQYQKKRIEARLDRRMIERYSEAAGHRIGSATEYSDECWHYWRGG